MRVRSITFFYNPNQSASEKILPEFAAMKKEAVQRFKDCGYEVQTTRLATTPFATFLPELTGAAATALAKKMEALACDYAFEFLSLGPALPDLPETYQVIPDILAATQNTFVSGIMADSSFGVNLSAVQACADVVYRAAPITPDGFANLRFTALANVPAYTPFFPAAYHQGDLPAFAMAIECADVVQQAFEDAPSLPEASRRLLEMLEKHAAVLTKIAEELQEKYQVEFKGLDFSPAPYPMDGCSLGGGLEELGLHRIGLNGSVAAAAFLADTLDRGTWKRAGFNGLMLPLLEDAVLAQRSIDGTLGIKDLLLFSTVCGTGLDTVPVPGDASPQQLKAVLLDVAALSVRLAKPLTARLMPVPGKKAGDLTEFDFAYFHNGKVLKLPAEKLEGLLGGMETFMLHPRPKR